MMTPKTEAELAEIMVGAAGPLAVKGGGTRGLTCEGATLQLAGLSGVTLYEPGALTLVAGAGTPVAEIDAMLAAENQQLAFEPMDHRGLMGTDGAPTIGGVVAANVSGPRRVQVGACRDHLLGVRFVDGQGTVIKNGGRVMKNVTGYDLVKLMCGSFGTLGVLSEVSLKVLPCAETQAGLTFAGLNDEAAVRLMSKALGSPFEVTGAAHRPSLDEAESITMIRIEGFEASVAYRAQKLQALLSEFGDCAADTNPDTSAANWVSVRDVGVFQNRDGDVWRVSVKPSDAPALVQKSGSTGVLYDWGGGLIWLLMPHGIDLRARLGAFAGHATLVRAAAETRTQVPMFHPEPAPLAALTAGLRSRFDPRGILNTGLMG